MEFSAIRQKKAIKPFEGKGNGL